MQTLKEGALCVTLKVQYSGDSNSNGCAPNYTQVFTLKIILKKKRNKKMKNK